MLAKTPHVVPSDLEGLPKEVIDALGISDTDMLEFQIVNVVNKNEGTANIDKIMIILFNDYGICYDRKKIASIVYRMTNKNMLFSSDLGKGFYTTEPFINE